MKIMREDSPKIDLERRRCWPCGTQHSRPVTGRGTPPWNAGIDGRVATTAAECVLYKQQITSITIPFSVPAAKCFDFEIQDVVVTAPCFAVKLFDHVKVEHI